MYNFLPPFARFVSLSTHFLIPCTLSHTIQKDSARQIFSPFLRGLFHDYSHPQNSSLNSMVLSRPYPLPTSGFCFVLFCLCLFPKFLFMLLSLRSPVSCSCPSSFLPLFNLPCASSLSRFHSTLVHISPHRCSALPPLLSPTLCKHILLKTEL